MDPNTIESVHARVGTTLRDKWVLGPVIGAGGTAAVYDGTHRTNGKRVAVKVMHSFLASSEDVVARFQREGYIANKVGHPGAVTILDDDVTDDGAPFLVMDRLDGEPLSRILDHATDGLAVGQVLSIATEVLDILAAAHAQGITHRDIKPDNVFLTTSGKIMLLDFGIARLREHMYGAVPGGADASGRNSARTQDGSALGTPQYMPPEQARGRWSEVDAQSDLWALGAMMFRLLTGKPVRAHKNTAEMLLSAMTERVPSVLSVGAVPEDVAAIVDKALEFEKRDRWTDARAMQSAVRAAAGRAEGLSDMRTLASLKAPATPLNPAAVAVRKRNRPLILLAGVTLAMAIVAIGLRSFEPRTSGAPAAPTTQSAVVNAPPTISVSDLPSSREVELPSVPAEPLDPVPQPRAPAAHRWRHNRVAAPASSPAPAPAPSPAPDPSTASSSLLDRRH